MERWIFLSGMMGSGKSTVGRELAVRSGVPFVDLDARITEREGQSVEAIFTSRGEAEFRRIEAEEVARLVAAEAPGVLALGGGTVVNAQTRRMLLRRGVLVTLTAPTDELARRLAHTCDRPLLAKGEAAQILGELLAEREDAYAECHGRVETSGRTPGEIADEIAALARARPVVVPLGRRTYRVDIGHGRLALLAPRLAGLGGSILVVTDENVQEPWARSIANQVGALATVVLKPGEDNKNIAAVERIWDGALDAGVDRSSVVLAIGGGVVGDVAGFAASALLRGIRFVQVPTSLLAMVDSSVGGKTGFDRAQGKNLIGSFHQPEWVVCDVDTLSTLPDVELRAGLAEVVKSAWLAGETALSALENDAEALLARDSNALERAVRMSVELKAEVVASDERESGRRMILNLGHTIGHAIEAARGYVGIRHGEAVALGMLAAHRIAGALGDPDADARLERLRGLLRRLELPSALDGWLDARTLAFVGADKKRVGSEIRFVVPHEPGRVEIVPLAVETIARALGVS